MRSLPRGPNRWIPCSTETHSPSAVSSFVLFSFSSFSTGLFLSAASMPVHPVAEEDEGSPNIGTAPGLAGQCRLRAAPVISFQMAEQLMTLAYDNGINLFDTAEVYAAGKYVSFSWERAIRATAPLGRACRSASPDASCLPLCPLFSMLNGPRARCFHGARIAAHLDTGHLPKSPCVHAPK